MSLGLTVALETAKDMRIGIFTLFRSTSPGTFFQARATVDVLQTLLPESQIELLDLQFVAIQPSLWWLKLGRRNLWKLPQAWRAYRAHRSNAAAIEDLPRSSYHVVQDYAKAMSLIQGFDYDALVVGSDEVLRLHPAWPIRDHYPPPSWLSPALSMPRYMLASSAGTTRWDDLSSTQQDLISASAQGFRWLGARDRMTVSLLKSACGSGKASLEQVPDPTFAFDIERWDARRAHLPIGRRSRRPLVGFWLTDYPWVRDLLDRFRRDGFQPVALDGEPGNFPSFGPYLSVKNFPRMFRQFDLVITSSLHYTIFSLRNGDVANWSAADYNHAVAHDMLCNSRAASLCACTRISGTAVVSHKVPFCGGPRVNSCFDTCPAASINAPWLSTFKPSPRSSTVASCPRNRLRTSGCSNLR